MCHVVSSGSSPGAAPWRIANVTWRTPSRWWWLEAIPDMWGLGEPELLRKYVGVLQFVDLYTDTISCYKSESVGQLGCNWWIF